MGDMIELDSGGKQFPAYVVRPQGEVKGGLIVIHEAWGLDDHIKSVAERYGSEGYMVIAPDLLSETGITAKLTGDLQEELFDPERRTAAQPKVRELMAPIRAPGFAEQTTAKVQECYDYLAAQENVGERVGITGFCFGGTYSFALAVHQPKLRVAVPFYGHADYSFQELAEIKCPILAFYGENDERLMAQLPELKAKMLEAGVDFTAQVYKDCGHAFFNDTNRFAYNKVAAKDAWEKALEFIEKSFRGN